MEKTGIITMLNSIRDGLKRDERVSSLFVTGSVHNDTMTPFSDIDLWIVFLEESGINSFKEEIATIFSDFGILMGVYDCTAHHFFIAYKSGIQVDLNLVTAAQYFSIKNQNENKNILFDRHLYVSQRSSFLNEARIGHVKNLLLVGYTTLERAISKFSKQNYFVVVRFLDSVRHNAIVPLLPFIEEQEISNAVALEIDKLSKEVRELFIETYSKPTKQSNIDGITAIFRLLNIISKRTELTDFKDHQERIKKFLLNEQIV